MNATLRAILENFRREMLHNISGTGHIDASTQDAVLIHALLGAVDEALGLYASAPDGATWVPERWGYTRGADMTSVVTDPSQWDPDHPDFHTPF